MLTVANDYIKDPSAIWAERESKTCLRYLDLRHNLASEQPWMDRLSMVWEEFGTPGIKDGEFSTAKIKLEHHPIKVDQELQDYNAILQLIRASSKEKDLSKGSRAHADILKRGLLQKDTYIGTALLSMYVKCGELLRARELFDELPAWDVVSWNALIAGYIQHGLAHEALKCFEQLQEQGLCPDEVALVLILKACGTIGALEKGEEIHAEVSRQEILERNVVLGNALVDMYAKCGAFAKAQDVFEKLPLRNMVSWNVLIAAYAQHGLGDECLGCLGRMQDEGLSPGVVTFICILKACGTTGAAEKGQEIHAELYRRGLEGKHIVLSTALVDMYAKCGTLAEARDVLDCLSARNVVTWNVLIAGYVKHGLDNEALDCYEQMQEDGVTHDVITFICILKACGSIGAAEKGHEIHAKSCRQGLLGHVVLGTALVDMYLKCGMIGKAREVFNELPECNVVTWNVLIAGYVQKGLHDEALNCFQTMQDEGFLPDASTFVCALKACSRKGPGEKGDKIHAEASRQGLVAKHIVLGNALVDMYAKCGALVKAQEVFNELPTRDVVSWNALIAGFAQHGFAEEAISCFSQMQDQGVSPDTVTFISTLKACGSIRAVQTGTEVHVEVSRQGLLEKDIILGNALVNMYANCGMLEEAQKVFDELPIRDAISWNALVAGYAQHGFIDEGFNCCIQMKNVGFCPEPTTYVQIFKACSSKGAVEQGEVIHGLMQGQGLLENNVVIGTALVDMYAKFGALPKAREVFDALPARDVALWTALIAGYAQHDFGDEALHCLDCMKDEGLAPNATTLLCILKACASIGAIEKGEEMHAEVMRKELLEDENLLVVGNALVDMYAKCGLLGKAQEMFDKLPVRDVVSWTTLIAGYCQFGQFARTGDFFSKMVAEGSQPNAVTFTVLLTACSHGGLVEDGQVFFERGCTHYGGIPVVAHFGCMVNLFSRAGRFDKALYVIKKVAPDDCLPLWSALLGACQNWVNLELGRWALEHAVELDDKFASAYVCMENIFAAAGMQDSRIIWK